MRGGPLFIQSFALEYEGPMLDREEIIPEGDLKIVDFPKDSPIKFDAFLDGSMKLYKVGHARFSGTPLYYACISAALLYRLPDGRLRNTTYTRNINLILFPFEVYRETFGERVKGELEEFQEKLKNAIIIRGNKFFTEDEIIDTLRHQSLESIFQYRDCWIICDISRTGISERRNLQIDRKDLSNFNVIKEKARARVRHYMRLLEFYVLKVFRERNEGSFVLVDGLYPEKRHVLTPFKLESEEIYREIVNRVVGFIKTPRDIPEALYQHDMWESLIPYRSIYWKGKVKEEGERAENLSRFTFSLMRFRFLPGFEANPVGIVKIQTEEEVDPEYLKNVLSAVYRERYPFVSDRRRFLNEAYPIEQAEKVAKSFFPSESRIRGFISTVIPELPYF